MSPKKTGATKSKITNVTAILIIGIMLVCLIVICFVGILLMNPDRVTSNPTSEPPLPIEKVIEMTFSAASAQTAMSYSPTPLTTPTLASFVTPESTATVFIFELQTQSLNTALPVYETNTPFILPSPVATNSVGGVCSCNGGLDCKDFSTHNQAQACFEYCKSLGLGDVHGLDKENDGLACENLP
jgi:hypothetical protein